MHFGNLFIVRFLTLDISPCSVECLSDIKLLAYPATALAMLVKWRAHRAACALSPTGVHRFFSSPQLRSPTGHWHVSSHGRCQDTRGVVTSGSQHASGYRQVRIAGRNFLVHRLAKLTFHGLPPDQQAWQVHHLDGNKANNRLDNLEYVTPGQNVLYSHENPLRRDNGPKLSKPVMWRAIGSQSWTVSPSVNSAAEQLGMSTSTVSRCCRSNGSSKGFEFQFQSVDVDLCGEEWQPMRDPTSGQEVPGRMVSSFGRITSSKGLVGFGTLSREGYFRTTISSAGSTQNAQVHRLMAFSFLGPPPTPKHTCVNHKDGNKSNNALENLEWTTQAENIAHYFAKAGGRQKRNTCKPVWSRLYGSDDEWTWHPSIGGCADSLGLNPKSVSACLCRGGIHTGGHEIRYAAAVANNDMVSFPGEEWRKVNIKMLLQDESSMVPALSLPWALIRHSSTPCPLFYEPIAHIGIIAPNVPCQC